MSNSNGGELINSTTGVNKNTIIRIYFDEVKQSIKEMELLKIIAESQKTFKLSNGVTISKGCLMPYHYKKHYHCGEEYFFLEKIII